MYIQESFDTIFNMGYGLKSHMGERVYRDPDLEHSSHHDRDSDPASEENYS